MWIRIYLPLLARHPAVQKVIGVDIDQSFLALARSAISGGSSIELFQSDALHLKCADSRIDFVWCAQSLYSLPSPLSILAEALRVLTPGDRIAIFENDTLHHILMPWPVDLEIALRQAEYQVYGEEGEDPRRFYVARSLPKLFRKAGFVPVSVRTYAHNRVAPFTPDEVCFFRKRGRTCRAATSLERFLEKR